MKNSVKSKGDVDVEDRHLPQEVFQPDPLLPDQFFTSFRREGRIQGEKRLMCAVLRDAVDCYQKHVNARDNRGKWELEKVRWWFMSNDIKWPFSFLNICDALDLDADNLREGLCEWSEKALAPGSQVIILPTSRKGRPNRHAR